MDTSGCVRGNGCIGLFWRLDEDEVDDVVDVVAVVGAADTADVVFDADGVSIDDG